MWEVLEHTADAGVRLRAPDLRSLLEDGVRALTDTIVDVDTVGGVEERRVRVAGVDEADLLVRLLGEALYLFDVERFLTASARVDELAPTSLSATLRGERLDARRHGVKTEVKAVTYHASGIRRTADGFEAEVIFDL